MPKLKINKDAEKETRVSRMVSLSLQANMSKLVREETYEGDDYWVLPVILMTPGVHNNILYTEEDLSKCPEGWNGVPVTVPHPWIEEGGKKKNVSANSPEMLSTFAVGRLFNCAYVDGKLKGEAWVNKKLAEKVSKTLVSYISEGKSMDVSTGLFTDDENTAGKWNNENYEAIARNHVPDHLALLPGEQGACGWADGAGAPRVNAAKQEHPMSVLMSFLSRIFPGFKGNIVNSDFLRESESAVRKMKGFEGAYAVDSEGDDCFFQVYTSENGVKNFRARMKKNGTCYEVDGEPEEVTRRTTFEKVVRSNIQSDPKTQTQGVPEMKVQVKTLIDLKVFAEADAPVLDKMSDEALDRLVKANTATPADPAAPAVPATPASDGKISLTAEELNARIQDAIKANTHRSLVAKVKANKACVLSEKALEAMTDEDLVAYEKSLPEVDFSGAAGAPKTNAEDQVPAMPSIMLPTPEKK